MAAHVEEATFRVGPFVVPLGPWSSEHIVDGEEGTDGASLKVSADRNEDQRWLNYALGNTRPHKRSRLTIKAVPLFSEIMKLRDEHTKKTRAGVRSHWRDLANPV